jgi:hypothetical protein
VRPQALKPKIDMVPYFLGATLGPGNANFVRWFSLIDAAPNHRIDKGIHAPAVLIRGTYGSAERRKKILDTLPVTAVDLDDTRDDPNL